MAQEILYTSAEKGLKSGSRGFCTVVSSEGMAKNIAERLEGLSGYRHVFGIHDANREWNPVNWAHTTMRIGGKNWHILSRVADAGQDYSGRTNKLAHHIALERSEQQAAGPARVLMADGVIHENWDDNVGIVPQRRLQQVNEPRTADCSNWKSMTGDAGWTGHVAEYLKSQQTPASIIFPVDTPNALGLVVEVLDLLPVAKRWDITFSTYFTQLVPGTECRLRFVLDGTTEAAALRNNPHAFVVDLCADLPPATGGELVEAATNGRLPVSALSAPARTTAKVQPKRETELVPPTSDGQDENEQDFEFAPADEDEFEEIGAGQGGTYSLQDADNASPERPRQPTRARRRDPAPVPPKAFSKRVLLIVTSIVAAVFLVAGLVATAFWMGRQSNADPFPDLGKLLSQADHPTFQPATPMHAPDSASPRAPAKTPPDTDGSNTRQPNPDAKPEAATQPDSAASGSDQQENPAPHNSTSGTNADPANTTKDTQETDPTQLDRDKPKNRPPAEPPRPKGAFVSLPDFKGGVAHLELPKLEDSTPKAWKLNSKPVSPMSIELLGGGLLLNKRDAKTENGFRVEHESDGNWVVTLVAPSRLAIKKETQIATITLKESEDGAAQLVFEWKANADPRAKRLKWALLRLESGDDESVVCHLSRPVTLPPIPLTIFLNGKHTFGIPYGDIGLASDGSQFVTPSFSLIGDLPAHISSNGAGETIVVPLRAGEFNADQHPYFTIKLTTKLSGADVILLLQKSVHLRLYDPDELETNFANYRLGNQTPEYRKPIPLSTANSVQDLSRKLNKSKWEKVVKQLDKYVKEAEMHLKSAEESAELDPGNNGLQDKVKEKRAEFRKMENEYERHRKYKFGDLNDKLQEINKRIEASSIEVNLSLQVNDGKRSYSIVVLETQE